MSSSIRQFIARLIVDETGQDLVEYAMLGALVALVTLAGLRAIENAIATNYVVWDTNEQNLWEPPPPP